MDGRLTGTEWREIFENPTVVTVCHPEIARRVEREAIGITKCGCRYGDVASCVCAEIWFSQCFSGRLTGTEGISVFKNSVVVTIRHPEIARRVEREIDGTTKVR